MSFHRSSAPRGGCGHVDRAIRHLREDGVSLLFLIHRLMQDLFLIAPSENAGEGAGTPISGNLVVLGLLRRDDQTGIDHRILSTCPNQILSLLQQSFHGLAWVAGRILFGILKDPLQPLELALCAPGVLFESPAQIV
jgi:hypothetical protein